ncbi:hypothetical protein [Microbulbifer halophilus]
MCPVCVSTATWLMLGGVSAGSVVTLGISRWRRKSRVPDEQ